MQSSTVQIELVKGTHVRELEHTLLVLAVVAEHAIERLKRHVATVQRIEHADRLHVMEKITTRALVIDIVEESLAGMAERRVPQVVTQTDRFNQIAVEPEGATDIARNAQTSCTCRPRRDKSSLLRKPKNLRFACITGVRR